MENRPTSAKLMQHLVSRLPHAAEILPDIESRYPALARITRFLGEWEATGVWPEHYERVRADLARDVVREWRPPFQMPEEEGTSVAAALGVVEFPTFNPIGLESGGIVLATESGERSQLRFDLPGRTDRFQLHALVRLSISGTDDFVGAVRFLHDGGPEETVLRFRPPGLVAFHSLFTTVDIVNHYALLSVGRSEGRDFFAVNGVPLLLRTARGEPPSGFAIDVIGTSDSSSRMDIGMLLLAEDAAPPFVDEMMAAGWKDTLVNDAVASGRLDDLSHVLHAIEPRPGEMDQHILDAALETNLAHARPYRDHVTAAILAANAPGGVDARSRIVARMAPETMIEVSGISVSVQKKNARGVSNAGFLSKREEVRLLDGVSFNAYPGDIVGVIGKNGAGKSTLLRTLISAMPICSGEIRLSQPALLLRPGAGMQVELTGRENIIKTGLHLGYLPGELEAIVDDVISFSELEEHIDVPFGYYSDGMRSRLVFSMATAIPRDILLLDELLGAGDAGFQKKAAARLNAFIEKAKVVVVVQHTFDFILARCTKCLYLQNGKQVFFGDPKIAIEMYKESY